MQDETNRILEAFSGASVPQVESVSDVETNDVGGTPEPAVPQTSVPGAEEATG